MAMEGREIVDAVVEKCGKARGEKKWDVAGGGVRVQLDVIVALDENSRQEL